MATNHTVDGLEVLVETPEGESRGKILLIHGAFHDASGWYRFQQSFTNAGYETYAISLTGHGDSEGRDRLRWYPASGFVNDIEKIAEWSGADYIVAHSLGGYLTLKFLEVQRPNLKAIVLLSSVGLPSSFFSSIGRLVRTGNLLDMLLAFVTMNIEPYKRVFVRLGLFSPDMPEQQRQELFDRFVAPNSESTRGYYDIILNPIRPQKVTQVPMLAISGEQDLFIVPSTTHDLAKALGVEARIVQAPGAGHDLMLDLGWERAFVETLQFLKSHA